MQELYTEAIQAQAAGRHEVAKHTYQLILDELEDGPSQAICQRLRYLSTKNTAELLQLGGQIPAALETYAKATGKFLLNSKNLPLPVISVLPTSVSLCL